MSIERRDVAVPPLVRFAVNTPFVRREPCNPARCFREAFAVCCTFADVGRSGPAHLGFGTGQHFCLGARLAEMQIRSFFDEFLRRYPLARPDGPQRRMRSNFVVGYKSIPVLLYG